MCIYRAYMCICEVSICVYSGVYVCLYARRIVICANVYMQCVWIYKSVM